jgi:hypothetical protein
VLEDRLGIPVESFAYPYGRSTVETRRMVSAHFRAACGTTLHSALPGSDRAELPRIDAYYFRPPALAPRIGTLSGNLYVRARRTAREWLRRTSFPARPNELPQPDDLGKSSCVPASQLQTVTVRRCS